MCITIRSAVVAVGLMWTNVSLGESTLPEWLIGQWQPMRSYFGTDPIGYCSLTIGVGQLSWRERPNDEARTYSYEVVVVENDFVIAKTEHSYGPPRICLNVPSPGYLRFDRKNYFRCTSNARRNSTSATATCPQPFDRFNYSAFELSVWRTLEGAMQIADNPSYWSGYVDLPDQM